jgi:hypothetical protein
MLWSVLEVLLRRRRWAGCIIILYVRRGLLRILIGVPVV